MSSDEITKILVAIKELEVRVKEGEDERKKDQKEIRSLSAQAYIWKGIVIGVSGFVGGITAITALFTVLQSLGG